MGKGGRLAVFAGFESLTFLSMLRKHFVLIPDQQESQNSSQARVARRSWFKRPKLPQVAAPDDMTYVPGK
jgi:hypothetical protein